MAEDPPLRSRLLSVIGLSLVAGGAVGVLGWHLDSTLLLQGVRGTPAVSYNVAVSLALAGLGILALAHPRRVWGPILGLAALTLLGILQLLGLNGLDGSEVFARGDRVWPSPLSVAATGIAAAGLFLLRRRLSTDLPRVGVAGATLLVIGVSGVLDVASGFPMSWAWAPLVERSLIESFGWSLLGSAFLVESTRGGAAERAPARRATLITGLAVLAVMVGLWQALVAQERRRLVQRLAVNSDRAATELGTSIQDRLAALERIGTRWGQERHSRETWELDTQTYLEPPLEFGSLHWVDRRLVRRWSVPSDAHTSALTSPAAAKMFAEVSSSRIPAVTPPLMVNGKGAVLTCAPVTTSETASGFLVGVVVLQGVFEHQAAQERRLGFSLRAISGVLPNLRFSSDSTLAPSRWALWSTPRSHLVIRGISLELAPLNQTLREGRSLLPEVTLGLGVLLALALAQMLYLAKERTARSRELTDLVRLRRAGEAKLAGALDDLQAQADALARANTLLQEEVATRERFEQRLERQARGLKRAARRLAVSNADLEQFAYVAAHDLRSPLRAIANLAQWIEDDLGEVSEETRENLDLLRARVERMEALLLSLLQYSRAGRAKSKPEMVSLPALLDDLETLLSPPAGVELLLRASDLTLETVRVPLETILRNLLSNALKHHDRDEGRVTLTIADEPDAVVFRVEDDGPGIKPEFHERIFGMFKTLRPRDRVEGSGMGLALVRRVARRYGGSISVDSPLRDGRGTAFVLRWPKELHDEEREDEAEEETDDS